MYGKSLIEIKLLSGEDKALAGKLIHLFHDVFQSGGMVLPDETYLQALLEKPYFRVFVLLCENEIVGGLTAYELPMLYSQSPELFIYDIAVREEFQGKGLGRQLLDAARQYCRERGIKSLFVDASESDKHALDFYRATGGLEEKVLQFTYLIR